MRFDHVIIENARVLRPAPADNEDNSGAMEWTEAPLVLSGGHVAGEDAKENSGRRLVIDGRGLLALPGLVDFHGDAFERQIMPRPGVRFDHGVALANTDRQLLAWGVTTAFHGLTWSWEPGLRGAKSAREFVNALAAARPHLGCDARLHLRFEVCNAEDASEVEDWISAGRVNVLGFNDHVDSILREIDNPRKLPTYTGRTGLSPSDLKALAERMARPAPERAGIVSRLADAARKAGVAMCSHDDPTPEVRERFRDLDCRTSEFPLNPETASAARAAGDMTVLGAPNVLRGKSHLARGISARQAAGEGLCDVLASDYYYPSLLQAPFVLDREGELPLERAWALVSRNAARAGGLADRGELAPGKRADVVLVDPGQSGRLPLVPKAVMTIAAGRPVFADAEAMRRMSVTG